MKVLISAGMVQAAQTGVSSYVQGLTKALSEDISGTLELFVVGNKHEKSLFPWIDEEHWINIPPFFASGALSWLWHQIKLPLICKQRGIDIVHIPSYRRILISPPCLQIATIHDCAPFFIPLKYGVLRGLFGIILAPWTARRCAKVICISESARAEILRYMKLSAEKVSAVYPGISAKFTNLPSSEKLKAFRAYKGLHEPYFLYVARLEHPGKNHIRLIEAFEQFCERNPDKKYKLALVGADWTGARLIRARIKESPVRELIKLPGFVANEDLPYWYAGAQSLIFPSLVEGFGLPLVEAFAMRIPVACSSLSVFKELGGDFPIYFDPLDISGMACALEAIVSQDKVEQMERIEKAYLRSQEFTWTWHAKRCIRLYSDMLSADN